jgi:hypothetical protein
MPTDPDRPELLQSWARLSPEDRQILLQFARLLLEPRLTGGLDELLRLQPGLFERDAERAQETAGPSG